MSSEYDSVEGNAPDGEVMTQEEEIFGKDIIADNDRFESIGLKMDIDSDNDAETDHGDDASDNVDDDQGDEDNFSPGDDDDSVLDSFARKKKKPKSKPAVVINKAVADDDAQSKTSTSDMGDDDDSDSDMKMKTSKNEEVAPKKKTAVETEIEIVKRLENGPSEADLKRQNAIEIDEDEMFTRMEHQKRRALAGLIQTAGLTAKEQLKKLRECQLWLSKKLNEGDSSKMSIENNFEKVVRLMCRHSREEDPEEVLKSNLSLIESAEDFDKFMLNEETMFQDSDKTLSASNANEPMSPVMIKSEITPSKASSGVICLSDSDSENDSDELPGAMDMKVDRDDVIKQAVEPAVSKMSLKPQLTIREKIKADLVNKRKQMQLNQSSAPTTKAATPDPKVIVNRSRHDLFGDLHNKAHKASMDYLCRVKKVDTTTSDLSTEIELAEKCRLFHELWRNKRDRDEERVHLERIARTLEDDGDDDEAEFGSMKVSKSSSTEMKSFTKEELLKLVQERKEQARRRRNEDSDSESDDDESAGEETEDVSDSNAVDTQDGSANSSDDVVTVKSESNLDKNGPGAVQSESEMQRELVDVSIMNTDIENSGETLKDNVSIDYSALDPKANSETQANATNEISEQSYHEAPVFKTYGRKSRPSRIVDDEAIVPGASLSGESMDVIEDGGSMNNNGHGEGGLFDLDNAESDGMETSEDNMTSTGEINNDNDKVELVGTNNEIEGSKPNSDADINMVTSAKEAGPSAIDISSKKDKKKEKDDDGKIKNAAYRLMLMQEEEDLKRARKLAKSSNGLLDVEAEEEDEDEKGIQFGLGEFGFTVAKKNDEDNDNEIKLKDNELDFIVDEVSDGEGDEEAGRQKRFEVERQADIKATKIMIENVTTGFRSKSKNKTIYDDEKVLASTDDSLKKQVVDEVQEFDEEEYFQEKNKNAQSISQSAFDADGSDASDDDDDDDDDEDRVDGEKMTLEEQEAKQLAKLKRAERKRREKAEIMRFEKNAYQIKALRQLGRNNSIVNGGVYGESQGSQIASNITIIKAGMTGVGTSQSDGADTVSSGLSTGSNILKRRTSKIPMKVNSAFNPARRQQSIQAPSNVPTRSSSVVASVAPSISRSNSFVASNIPTSLSRSNSVVNGLGSVGGSSSLQLLSGLGESSNSGIGASKGMTRVNSIVTEGLISGGSSVNTPRITPLSTSAGFKRNTSFAADLMDSAMVRQFGSKMESQKPLAANDSKRPRLLTPSSASAGSLQHNSFIITEKSNDGLSNGGSLMQRSGSNSNFGSSNNNEEKRNMASLFSKGVQKGKENVATIKRTAGVN